MLRGEAREQGEEQGERKRICPGRFLARAGLAMAILVRKMIMLFALPKDFDRAVLEFYPTSVDGVRPGYVVIDIGALAGCAGSQTLGAFASTFGMKTTFRE